MLLDIVNSRGFLDPLDARTFVVEVTGGIASAGQDRMH
jgi:hypothetical protein